MNRKIKKFDNKPKINKIRSQISNDCFNLAHEKQFTGNVCRLSVPTGLGKTLSSLRFAIERAKICKKDHIFYIAPFNSILEQNASEIRKIVGNENILEHYCNIVMPKE